MGGVLALAVVLAAVQVVRLWRVLGEVERSARLGQALIAATLPAADSLLEVVAARADTIRRLTHVRDSLLDVLEQRLVAIPPRPAGPIPTGCGEWVARADSLAGALTTARTALDTGTAVLGSQRASLRDLAAVADTLRPALVAASDAFGDIAESAERAASLRGADAPRVAVFGEASVGAGGVRAEAGLALREWFVSVEEGPTGRALRLGVRKSLRLF
jgi:hypothetical protein